MDRGNRYLSRGAGADSGPLETVSEMNDDDDGQYRSHPVLTRRQFLAGTLATAGALGAGFHSAEAASATAIFRGPTTKPTVALTFDCGSDTGYAASILDTFAREGVKGSFGMTGTWAEANPALVRRMVSEGHQLINHTYSHPSFTGYSDPSGPISSTARKDQITRCERVVADIAGVAMKPYFRPPYGDYDDSVLADAGAIGFTSCVLWSLDGFGWKGLTQDQIVNRVASNHGNGYIYLFHVGAASQEGPALPRIISTLRGKGYGFATVTGLLGGGGTPPAAKFVAGDTVKVTAGLYLRTGAGSGYSVITTMPTGTVCTVVSGPTVANGYSWYKLSTPYGQGWAAGEYLAKTSGGTTPPPVATFVAGDKVKVTAGLYLRTGPGTGYGVIVTMPTGTVCTIVSGAKSGERAHLVPGGLRHTVAAGVRAST